MLGQSQPSVPKINFHARRVYAWNPHHLELVVLFTVRISASEDDEVLLWLLGRGIFAIGKRIRRPAKRSSRRLVIDALEHPLALFLAVLVDTVLARVQERVATWTIDVRYSE